MSETTTQSTTRATIATRRLLRPVAMVWLAAVAVILAPLPPTAAAAAHSPGCRDEVVAVRDVAHTVSNCSDLATAGVAALLSRTDAAYLGLIRPGDRLMANAEWVAWIDTQDAPGILRGLWPVDAEGRFTGVEEPTVAPDAAKSVVAVNRGVFSTDAPFGYKGLHVEIWKTVQSSSDIGDECAPANCFYSVPNGSQYVNEPGTLGVTASYSVANYHSALYNSLLPRTPSCTTCGTTTFVGLNGVSTELTWSVSYVMSRNDFTIETALSASADVNLGGAAGGLLLLLNPACAQVPRRAYVHDTHFVSCDTAAVAERGIHQVEGPAIARGLASASANVAVSDGRAEAFAPGSEVIDRDEDRSVAQYGDRSPLTFRYANGSTALTVTPGWSFTDPAGQPYRTALAMHFNATPGALGWDPSRGQSGVNGLASVDVFTVPAQGAACPAAPCSLSIGPDRGILTWRASLDH